MFVHFSALFTIAGTIPWTTNDGYVPEYGFRCVVFPLRRLGDAAKASAMQIACAPALPGDAAPLLYVQEVVRSHLRTTESQFWYIYLAFWGLFCSSATLNT